MSNARENVNLLTSADWDIATLRLANWGSGAVPPQVVLKTNYVAGDGGGLFRYDASDTTTADDGGVVIVDATGNRWKRQWNQTATMPEWFGNCATPQGFHTAITAAINYWSPFNQFAVEGGAVQLAAKPYSTNASIDLTNKHGVTISGVGMQATQIQATGNFPVFSAVGSLSEPLNKTGITNMTIRGGGKANVLAHGISLTWTNRCFIERVLFFSCRRCLEINHAWQLEISACHAHGAGIDQSYEGLYQGPTTLVAIDNTIIMNGCTFQDIETNGWRCINGQGSKVINTEFSVCETGVYWGNPPSGTVKFGWVHMVNCLVDSCTTENFVAIKGAATEHGQCVIGDMWTGNSSGHGAVFEDVRDFAIDIGVSYYHFKHALKLDGCDRVDVQLRKAAEWNREAAGINNYAGVALVDTTYSTIFVGNSYSNNGAPETLVESGTSNFNVLLGQAEQGATITGLGTTAMMPNSASVSRFSGLRFGYGQIFREVNNGALTLSGGTSASVGANIELFGGNAGGGLDNTIILDASQILLRSQAGSEYGRAIASSGSLNVNTEYRVNSIKVVGAQGASVTDASGGVTVDAEARTAINTLLSRLRAHGLIAT